MAKDRHIENTEGDFYVERESCISCGAPHAEAPDLIEHSEKYTGHCFFKKQPITELEIEMAINAIAVSCVGALRYAGTEQKIISRLCSLGCEHLCDNQLEKQ